MSVASRLECIEPCASTVAECVLSGDEPEKRGERVFLHMNAVDADPELVARFCDAHWAELKTWARFECRKRAGGFEGEKPTKGAP